MNPYTDLISLWRLVESEADLAMLALGGLARRLDSVEAVAAGLLVRKQIEALEDLRREARARADAEEGC